MRRTIHILRRFQYQSDSNSAWDSLVRAYWKYELRKRSGGPLPTQREKQKQGNKLSLYSRYILRLFKKNI